MVTSSGRVIDFFPENNDSEQKNNRTTTTPTPTRSSTARARMSVGRNSDSSQKLYQMFVNSVQYFEESFCTRAGFSMKTDVREAILRGMTDDVIISCIQEAERAPRPSWGYARAVMNRCLEQGILTAEDWSRDQQQRKSRKNISGNFIQREYTLEDFSESFVTFDL